MSHFFPYTIGAYSLCTMGMICIYALSMQSTRSAGRGFTLLFWIASTITTVSALALAFFWHYRHKIRNVFRIFVGTTLDGDLSDIAKSFGLTPQDGSHECFPSGPNGFWIAETNEEVVEFVGLGN
jgi:hypothetical protein